MTGRRPPNWQRKGYKNEAEYRAACAATKKTQRAALAASKARYAAGRVLEVMWRAADFDRPNVTITKEQIVEKAGYELWTVKKALRELREEGSIKPAKRWEGGRGIATEWRLCVPGCATTPADEEIERMEDRRKRQAAWDFLKSKYGPLKALEIMGPPEDE